VDWEPTPPSDSASSACACGNCVTALGLTVEEVATELLCSATKISRLETGQRWASLRDVRDLCRICGVTD